MASVLLPLLWFRPRGLDALLCSGPACTKHYDCEFVSKDGMVYQQSPCRKNYGLYRILLAVSTCVGAERVAARASVEGPFAPGLP